MAKEPNLTDDEIWDWYLKCEEQDKLGLIPMEYCKQHGVDYKRYSNMRYRYVFKRDSDPKEYKKMMALVDQFEQSNLSQVQFAKSMEVPFVAFRSALTHKSYLNAIARLKEERKSVEKPMKFVEMKLPAIIPEEAQVVEPQNDLEIIISKGVKVSIAPNVDTMKVVKIIEFLKDL